MMRLWMGRGRLGAGAVATVTGLLASSVRAQGSMPEPPPPMEPWYDAMDFRAFVDAYGSINYNLPKPQDRGYSTRAFDTTSGFALAWAGVDASYEPDPVGGAIGLRWGPQTEAYTDACAGDPVTRSTPCDTDLGLQFLKQAYVSWRPDGPEGRVKLDLGKFDTIYGAEVAESQDDMNYTRGIVYWYTQPTFHTGFRGNVELSAEVDVTALAVNGYNNSVDNNSGKTFGVQIGWQPSDAFGASIGWLGGPEQDDAVVLDCATGEAYDADAGGCAAAAGEPGGQQVVDRGNANDFDSWRHLFDVVLDVAATDDFTLVLNADLAAEGVRTIDAATLETRVENVLWYGAMLGARLQLDEHWAVAARGEYLGDPDGHVFAAPDGSPNEGFSLATGTLTLEAAPTENLVLRLEQRGDFPLSSNVKGGKSIFPKREREVTDSLMTTTLGVVLTTN